MGCFGFPIVIGTSKSCSSRCYSNDNHNENNTTTTTQQYHRNVDDDENPKGSSPDSNNNNNKSMIMDPLIVVGSNDTGTISATCIIQYYYPPSNNNCNNTNNNNNSNSQSNNNNDGDAEQNNNSQTTTTTTTEPNNNNNRSRSSRLLMANVRVEMSIPSTTMLKSSCRTNSCDIPILIATRGNDDTDEKNSSATTTTLPSDNESIVVPVVSPQLVFSGDGKYLACLIPKPPTSIIISSSSSDDDDNNSTILLIWTLQRPSHDSILRYHASTPKLQLPSYITKPKHNHHNHHPFLQTTTTNDATDTTTNNNSSSRTPMPPLSHKPAFPRIVKTNNTSSSSSSSTTMEDDTTFLTEDNNNWVFINKERNKTKLTNEQHHHHHNNNVSKITCICNANVSSSSIMTTTTTTSNTNNNNNKKHSSSSSSSCVLLAGCADGSILAIHWKQAKVIGTVLEPSNHNNNHNNNTDDDDNDDTAIVPMFMAYSPSLVIDHHPTNSTTTTSQKDGNLIVITNNGKATIYSSTFVPTSTTTSTLSNTTNNNNNGHYYYYPTPIPLKTATPYFNTPNDDDNYSNNNKEQILDSVKRVVSFTPATTIKQQQQQEPLKITSNDDDSNNTTTIHNHRKLQLENNNNNNNNKCLTPPSKFDDVVQQQPNNQNSHNNSNDSGIVATSSTWLNDSGGLLLLRWTMTMTYSFPKELPPYAYATFVDSQTVAFLTQPKLMVHDSSSSKNSDIVAQVWDISRILLKQQQQQSTSSSLIPPPPTTTTTTTTGLISSLVMTSHDLFDQSQGTFSLPPNNNNNNNDATTQQQLLKQKKPTSSSTFSLHCDPETKCFAISSIIKTVSSSSLSSSSYQPFVCIWDWRNNMTGFILTTTQEDNNNNNNDDYYYCNSSRQEEETSSNDISISQLTFCHHPFHGNQILHTFGNIHNLRKCMYPLGIISPSETISKDHCTIEEASSLIVHADSISFPFFSDPEECQDSTIRWKEAKVPSSYIAMNGSIQLATMGRRYGRSIAVASSRGLCLLDMSSRRMMMMIPPSSTTTNDDDDDDGKRQSPCMVGEEIHNHQQQLSKKNIIITAAPKPKWRLFANLVEEQSFQVISMTWWERNSHHNQNQNHHSTSEDLLLAIVRYHPYPSTTTTQNHSEDDEKNQQQLYLVCWSRRHLSLQYDQILYEIPIDDNDDDDGRIHDQKKGFALPKHMHPGTISLLSEPDNISGDRAVVLVTSSSSSSSQGAITYMMFQMQVLTQDDDAFGSKGSSSRHHHHPQTISLQQRNKVAIRLSSTGQIQPNRNYDCRDHRITGAFLAGASFQFDLRNKLTYVFESNLFIGTLGIFQSDGETVWSVAISPYGPASSGLLFGGQRPIRKYWLSDVKRCLPSKQQQQQQQQRHASNHSVLDECYIWSFACDKETTFCWAVPFIRTNSLGKLFRLDTNKLNDTECIQGKNALKYMESESSLLTEEFQHGGTNRLMASKVNDSHDILGITIKLGSFLTGSSTSDNGICLGPVPSSHCKSILYASQRFRRQNLGLLSNCTSLGTIFTYGIGNCVVALPSITASLYLAAATSCSSLLYERTGSHDTFSSWGQDYAQALVKRNIYFDSGASAICRIITYMVEILSALHKKNDDQVSLNCMISIKLGLVEAVKSVLTPLQTASIFGRIGRQLEAHQLKYLFPLTTDESDTHLCGASSHPLRTIDDIFLASVSSGSVSVASSLLPLFETQDSTKIICLQLLHHCLNSIDILFEAEDTYELSCWKEELIFLQQIFSYALKLEEAYDVFNQKLYSDQEINGVHPYEDGSCGEEIKDSFEDSMDASNDEVKGSGVESSDATELLSDSNSQLSIQKQRKGLISLFSPQCWKKYDSNIGEEKKISEAASQFILSGYEFESDSSEYEDCNEEEDSFCSAGIYRDDYVSKISSSMVGEEDFSAQIFANETVASLTGKLILYYIQRNKSKPKGQSFSFWEKILFLNKVLEADFPKSSSLLNDSAAKKALKSFLDDDIDGWFQLNLLGNQGNENSSSLLKGNINNLVALSELVSQCRKEIDKESASELYGFIVSLLANYIEKGRNQSLTSPWLIIMLVAGLVSGQLNNTEGQNDNDDYWVGICSIFSEDLELTLSK